jgi:hypothetical protein
MACSLALTLLLALPGQPLSTGPIVLAPPLSEDAAVRLAYMKDTVAAYRIHRRAAGSPLFKLRAEPIFRLDNPVTGVKDSAFFFWTDPETGRPEATIQMFRAPTKYWIHDWTSLSTSPIVAEVGGAPRWWPKAGVEFRPVPGAPVPAATPAARLRQIRALAEEFSATDDFLNKGWSQLRLMPKPWLRYGKAGSAVEDGALFAFALGTEPEVALMIEARPGPSSGRLRWEYGLAPLTSFELKVSRKGTEVWRLPWSIHAKDPSDRFYDMYYSREPDAPNLE